MANVNKYPFFRFLYSAMTLEKYFSQVTVVEHKNGVKEAVARS
jgi:hypothetical protein